jgi:hypothetical protein
VARVTYAALGLAFAALVGGFFIRTSSVPLIASIALSVAVSALILAGWTRRMRREGLGEAFEDEEVLVQDIEVAEVDDKTRVVATADVREKLKKKVGARPRRDLTEEQVAIAPPKPKRKPAAASRPPAMAARAEARPAARRAGRPSTRTSSRPAASARSRRVFVIPGRERYHAEDCRYATGDDLREVSEDLAKRRGYTACGLCLKKKR